MSSSSVFNREDGRKSIRRTVGCSTRLHVITSLKTAVFITVFEDPNTHSRFESYNPGPHRPPPHPVSLTSILISFYLRLGLCLLNPGFLNTSLCAFLFSPKSGTCSTLSCFLISSTYNISCGVKTKKILTKVSSSLLLNPSKALFSILISGALIPCYSLNVG